MCLKKFKKEQVDTAKRENGNKNLLMEVNKESFYQKIIHFIKNLLHLNWGGNNE